MSFLDILFPKYCVNCKKYGEYLCPNCFTKVSFDVKNICAVCSKPSILGDTHPICHKKYSIDGVSAAVKFNPVTKKLIYSFKYKPYVSSLSKFIAELFYESIIQKEELKDLLESDFILVPIPISKGKLKSRGYNQAEILAKELAIKLNKNVVNILERVKETKTQVKLSKEERRENLKNVFKIKGKYLDLVKESNILLIDDVLTSGATFSEAGKVLKKDHSAKVWGIAFAKED